MGDLALHLLVVAGGKNACFVQPHGDGIEASALGSPTEHPLHHDGGNRVNDKLVATSTDVSPVTHTALVDMNSESTHDMPFTVQRGNINSPVPIIMICLLYTSRCV